MADLINVTPEKLKATASSFQQAGKDVKKTTSGVERRVVYILVSLMDWMPISPRCAR